VQIRIIVIKLEKELQGERHSVFTYLEVKVHKSQLEVELMTPRMVQQRDLGC